MAGTLRLAPGVQWTPTPPQCDAGGFRLLGALEAAATLVGVDLVLTCTNGGHPPTDPHTLGHAVDVRVSGFDVVVLTRVVAALVQDLGRGFTVLYEVPTPVTTPLPDLLRAHLFVNPEATGPHLHLQVTAGTVYPPPARVE